MVFGAEIPKEVDPDDTYLQALVNMAGVLYCEIENLIDEKDNSSMVPFGTQSYIGLLQNMEEDEVREALRLTVA